MKSIASFLVFCFVTFAQEGVVPVDENFPVPESGSQTQNDRMEAMLKSLVGGQSDLKSIAEKNLKATEGVVSSQGKMLTQLSSIEKSNSSNTDRLVSAIVSLREDPDRDETSVKTAAKQDEPKQQFTYRTETRYRLETRTRIVQKCYGTYCVQEPVTETVRVPYTVRVKVFADQTNSLQDDNTRDVIPIEDGSPIQPPPIGGPLQPIDDNNGGQQCGPIRRWLGWCRNVRVRVLSWRLGRNR